MHYIFKLLFMTFQALALTPKDWEGLWKWEISAEKNGELSISKCSKEGCNFTLTAIYGNSGEMPGTCIEEGRFVFTNAKSATKKLTTYAKDAKTKCELKFSLNPKTQSISAKAVPEDYCVCDAGGRLSGPYKNAKSVIKKSKK